MRRSAACVFAALALAGSALADDVYLVNGSVFEDVVTHTTQTHVVIEMAIGKMTLPIAQVEKVVVADTPIAEFQRRHQGLLEDPTSQAIDWLQLSRWGLSQGLSSQAGQAALFAARLDAGLEGLAPLLQGLGYDYVDDIGWIPHSDAMRMRGLVLYDGEWMSKDDRNARIASDRPQRSEPRQARSSSDRPSAENTSDNAVALASIKLAEKALDQSRQADRRSERRSAFGASRVGVYGGVVFPAQRFATAEQAAAYNERVRNDLKALASRPPGSIIPLNNTGPQRSGVFNPPQQ